LNKREIKLEKKLISKLCLEVDQATSLGRQLKSNQSGFKQTETVTGLFSTIIIDLTIDSLYSLG
jgi:hypothetical protein